MTPPRGGIRLGLAMALAGVGSACLGPTQTTSPTASASPAISSPIAVATPAASPLTTASPAVTPAVAAKPAPCPGTDRTPGAPAGRQVSGSSANWSGYVAAVKKAGSVTCVEGSWVEPDVTCSRTGHQAVATWIGIDGFTAKTLGIPETEVLVQIGTQADCTDGVESHYAWREILPGEPNEVHIPAMIKPGDHLSARITYADGRFTLQLVDTEAVFSFTYSAMAPGAPRRTAEWIVEAPATDCPGSCSPVALPKFSAVIFTNAHATIAGQRSSISDDSWTHVKLRMSRNGVARTSTSSLSSHGTSFKVTFLHR